MCPVLVLNCLFSAVTLAADVKGGGLQQLRQLLERVRLEVIRSPLRPGQDPASNISANALVEGLRCTCISAKESQAKGSGGCKRDAGEYPETRTAAADDSDLYEEEDTVDGIVASTASAVPEGQQNQREENDPTFNDNDLYGEDPNFGNDSSADKSAQVEKGGPPTPFKQVPTNPHLPLKEELGTLKSGLASKETIQNLMHTLVANVVQEAKIMSGCVLAHQLKGPLEELFTVLDGEENKITLHECCGAIFSEWALQNETWGWYFTKFKNEVTEGTIQRDVAAERLEDLYVGASWDARGSGIGEKIIKVHSESIGILVGKKYLQKYYARDTRDKSRLEKLELLGRGKNQSSK